MDNKNNRIVSAADWVFDTAARVLVSLFDGLRHAVEHATPSLFGLVATALPYALPLPVAFMTAHSAQLFFDWDPWAAWTLGLGLEGLGLLVWVRLVDGILAKARDAAYAEVVNYLWGVAVSYEVVLVLINVVLAFREGASLVYALTLLLICFLPALSAAMYGIHRRETLAKLERQEKEVKEQREKERQERREDRLKSQEMKLKYAAEAGETPTFRKSRKQ